MVVDNDNTTKTVIVVNAVDLIPTIEVMNARLRSCTTMYWLVVGGRGGNYRGGNRGGGNAAYNGNGYPKSSQYQGSNEQHQVRSAPPNQQQ